MCLGKYSAIPTVFSGILGVFSLYLVFCQAHGREAFLPSTVDVPRKREGNAFKSLKDAARSSLARAGI